MPLPVSENPVTRSRRRLVADYEKTSQGLRTWSTVLPPRPPVAPPSPRPPPTSPPPQHERWSLAADFDAAWERLSQRCVILPPRATPYPPTLSPRPLPRDVPLPRVPTPPVPLMTLKVVPTLEFIKRLPRLMDLVVSPRPRRRPTLHRHLSTPVPGPYASLPLHHRQRKPLQPPPVSKSVGTLSTATDSPSEAALLPQPRPVNTDSPATPVSDVRPQPQAPIIEEEAQRQVSVASQSATRTVTGLTASCGCHGCSLFRSGWAYNVREGRYEPPRP